MFHRHSAGTVRLSMIRGGHGSAGREIVCQFASPNGVKHVTVHSGFIAQIFLIQIILTRKNVFVKRKIGNLFETKADYWETEQDSRSFSDDGYCPSRWWRMRTSLPLA